MNNSKKKLHIFCSFLLCLLAGCGEKDLFSQLTTRDAIEIEVLLQRAGISVERQRVGKGQRELYQISVDEADYEKATQVLYEFGLPREASEGIEQFTRSKGFVPNSPEVSALRLDYALALQIERLLSSVGGVVDTKVSVQYYLSRVQRQRERKGVGAQESGAGATVMIRYASQVSEPPFDVEEIRQMVAQNVPGLRAEQVIVSLHRVSALGLLNISQGEESLLGTKKLTKLFPFFLDLQVPRDAQRSYQRRIAWFFFFTLACAGVVGFFCGWIILSKKKSSGGSGGNFFIEASYGDEGEVLRRKIAKEGKSEKRLPGTDFS